MPTMNRLIEDTQCYTYTSNRKLRDILDQRRTDLVENIPDNQYVVFADVSWEAFEKLDEDRRFPLKSSLFTYNVEAGILQVKFRSSDHDFPVAMFNTHIVTELMAMNKKGLSEFEIISIGRTTFNSGSWFKQSDTSYAVQFSRRGEDPTFVIEVGMPESRQKFTRDARWWLEETPANVVVTIDVHRTKMDIRIGLWELVSRRYSSTRQSPGTAQETKSIMISRPSNTTIVTGQLDIPFEEVFRRPPTGAFERDFTFSVAKLTDFAETIWRTQELLEW